MRFGHLGAGVMAKIVVLLPCISLALALRAPPSAVMPRLRPGALAACANVARIRRGAVHFMVNRDEGGDLHDGGDRARNAQV